MADLYSKAEIADLVRQLLAVPQYGWHKDRSLLARTIADCSYNRLQKMLSGCRPMSIRLQTATSARLRQVVAGELVCQRRYFGPQGKLKLISECIQAENPVDLGLKLPIRGFVSVSRKGVQVRFQSPQMAPDHAKMPTFREMWERLGGSNGRPA